jgi:hypothetical protein
VDPRNSALRHNRSIINEYVTIIYKTKIMHELQTFKKVWSSTTPTCLSSGSSLRKGANSPKDVGVGTDHTFLNVCNLFIKLVVQTDTTQRAGNEYFQKAGHSQTESASV